jgi:LysM repeat protein
VTIDAGQEEFPAICPYLGLADDADSHATYATDAHRCYRLPNPTRIATGHQDTYCLQATHTTCPVFLGEAGARTAPAAAAPAAPPAGRTREKAPSTRVTQPLGGSRPRTAGGAAAGAPQRQRRERPAAGSLNPRPRAGGISMPVATIGLFAMAVVVIVVAILIQQAVGGGDDGKTLSPADVTGTQAALRAQTRLPSQQAGTPGTQQPGTPNPNQTPGAGTPVVTRTGTPGTPATTGQTYTVKSGDTCGAIAAANNIKLQELLDANKMTEGDCTGLQIGQVLKLP